MKPNTKTLLTLLLSVLLLAAASGYASSTPTNRQISIWLTTLLFGGWVAFRWRQGSAMTLAKTTLPLFLYLLLLALLVPITPLPYAGAERVSQGLILLLGFVFVQDTLGNLWQARTWENALLLLAVLVSIGELILVVTWFLQWIALQGSLLPLPPVGYRLAGILFGHANITAGFLNIVIMIVLVRALKSKSRSTRLAYGLLLTSFMVVAYFASSRGGWIAMLAGIATTSLTVLVLIPRLRERAGGSEWRPHLSWKPLTAGIVCVALLLAATYSFFSQAQSSPGHAPVASARKGIWGPALNSIKTSPIWGHGPGAFSMTYAEMRQIPPGFATSHAHNIVLQIGLDAGIIGIAVIAWGAMLFLRGVWRTWQRAGEEKRLLLASYAGSFVALALHHGIDYLFESPLYALSVLILTALALRDAPHSENVIVPAKPALTAVSILLVLYVAASFVLLRGNTIYWKGVQAGRQGHWDAAQEWICEAKDANPAVTLFAFQCGLAQAFVGYPESDPATLEAAKESFENGLSHDPGWPVHWANLAAVEWELGEVYQAHAHMLQAVERAPRNALFALYLGWMEEQLENQAEALHWYKIAVDLDPWLQDSQLLEASSFSAEIEAAQEQEQFDGWRDQLTLLGWGALREGDTDKAYDLFLQSLDQLPQDSRAYAGLAYVLDQRGDDEAAWHYIQIALFIDASIPPSSPLLHIAGHVASSMGHRDDAIWYFEQAFHSVFNSSLSWQYYDRTYLRYFLDSDIAPWISRVQISSEMIPDFVELARDHDQNGRHATAQRISGSILVR